MRTQYYTASERAGVQKPWAAVIVGGDQKRGGGVMQQDYGFSHSYAVIFSYTD